MELTLRKPILKSKRVTVLGNGQIWDLKGIDPKNPDSNFEDVFSGRALGRLANSFDKKLFSKFIEKRESHITGMSVTLALNSKNKKAQAAAKAVLSQMAQIGARGIEILTKEKWRGLKAVIIGGGVSAGKTGKILVEGMKKYLRKAGLDIKVYQAKFPGKEAGFLGAIAHIELMTFLEEIGLEYKKVAVIGLDIGREDIGCGVIELNNFSGEAVKNKGKIIIYQSNKKMPISLKEQKIFQNSYRSYSPSEIELGKKLRGELLKAAASQIVDAYRWCQSKGKVCSNQIGVAVPGEPDKEGYLIGSTQYLPFLQKKDGFRFKIGLETATTQCGMAGFCVHPVNDGIAALLANLEFGLGLNRLEEGKYAFLGPGSGLGGGLVEVNPVRD
jgi:hypothetical protein